MRHDNLLDHLTKIMTDRITAAERDTFFECKVVRDGHLLQLILTEFKCRLPPFIRINGTAIVFDELLVSTAAGIKAITTMAVWILLIFIIISCR